MRVCVLLPFTSTEEWRLRAFNHVASSYLAGGYDIAHGACEGAWRKAVAVGDAAARTAAEILVVADADCLCDGVPEAAAAVQAGAAWAVPHLLVHRLDQTATEAVYQGTPPASTTGRAQRPYKGFAGGGIVVLTRQLYERVPLDPRFEGWGGEDSSWALALECLAGPPHRGPDDLFHLYHPAAARMSRRWGTPAGRALEIRYHRAAKNRRAMADIIREARQVAA